MVTSCRVAMDASIPTNDHFSAPSTLRHQFPSSSIADKTSLTFGRKIVLLTHSRNNDVIVFAALVSLKDSCCWKENTLVQEQRGSLASFFFFFFALLDIEVYKRNVTEAA